MKELNRQANKKLAKVLIDNDVYFIKNPGKSGAEILSDKLYHSF